MNYLTKIKRIVFFFILSVFFFHQANAQNKDTLAVVLLSEPMLINNALQFDIKLHNPTDEWLHWVSGTFVFTIPGINLNQQQYFVEYAGTTDLNAVPMAGNDLPEDAYVIQPDIVDGPCGPNDEYRGRLSITVTGPDSLDDTNAIPQGDTISIGKFVVMIADDEVEFPPDVPERMMWLEPYEYYQACAYQTEQNIPVGPTNANVFKFRRADNIEMSKYGKGIVKFDIYEGPEPCYKLLTFNPVYTGTLNVDISWSTDCEAYNGGFMLLRGMRFSNDVGPCDVDYTDTLARYDVLSEQSSKLQAKGGYYSGQGAEYGPYNDVVQYRDVEYCYQLLHFDEMTGEWIRDTCSCLPIPHAVITYAQGNPNPFSDRSIIKFILADDVYLTVKVVDLTGKTIKYLDFNDERMNRAYVERTPPGTQYEVELNGDELAAQGLYDVIFLAYPIDDPVYEFSRAVVKLQLIR